MDSWKKAFDLALFELKESKKGFVLSFVFSLFIVLYMITSFPSYLDNSYLGVDSLFFLAFTVAPLWAKPKYFQVQKVQSGHVAPIIIILRSLPIPRDIIVKSRLIIHYAYTLPVQIVLLTSIYLFSEPIQNMMALENYFVFVIIWLSFGIYVGSLFSTVELGDDTPPIKMMIEIVVTVFVGFFIFITIIFLSEHGIVHWTLIFAQKWPFVSAILSILLAIVGGQYWYRYMKKRMDTFDYM